MLNLHLKLDDQCLLTNLQSFEVCQAALRSLLACYYRIVDVVAICCQHVFSQMLHVNYPMNLLQFLHVLNGVIKNQQHLGELFHKPICVSL